jgi:hypothetical protein
MIPLMDGMSSSVLYEQISESKARQVAPKIEMDIRQEGTKTVRTQERFRLHQFAHFSCRME